MRRRGSASFRWVILAGMVIAILGSGRESLAGHYSFVITGDCYQCHNLNPDAIATDPATSYILNDSFVKRMKLVNGGTTPQIFGCDFCHQYQANTVMRDAFFALGSGTSVHPVDFPYSVDARRNVSIDFTSLNQNRAIYNSNWDKSWANFSNQIDCIDCHDAAMDNAAYPNHSPLYTDNTATAANPATARYYNPYMLRNVPSSPASGYSWSGGTVQGHAPNAFCLLTCHDDSPANAAKGTTMGHYGWGGFGVDNTLREASGTPLKGGSSARCADCHETHTARTKDNLFGELGNQMSSQSYNLISESNCTAVCHDDTAFLSSGHHKDNTATQSFTCVTCHNATLSHRDASNPRRLSGTVDTRPASVTENLSANGLDDNYDGVVDDTGEEAFAYSLESSCRTCHSSYIYHNGQILGATPSTGQASCLNCHDPHGKGVFNGTGNNVKMIRARVVGENTVYTSKLDMWRDDGRGVCDNPNCHGGKPMGDNTLALGTIMGDVADHRSAGVTYTTDCVGCHLHTSESGSFKPACNGCHDYPGQRHLSTAHQLSPVHKIHAYMTNQTLPTTETGYGFTCGTCHFSYTHNQMGIGSGSQWDNTNNTYVQVVFDPDRNPGATYTLGGTPQTGTCGNLTCHGATLPVPAQGTQTTPRWNVVADGDCGTCHKATGASPPGTAAHVKHASSDYNSGYNYGCQTCHYDTTADGTTIPVSGRAFHVYNRLADLKFNPGDPRVSAGAYTGTPAIGDNAAAYCSNIYCHSPGYAKTGDFDNGALGPPDWNAGAALACNACHGAPGQTGVAVGAPSYANGTPKANTHPKHVADGFGCQVCHYTTTKTGNSVIGVDRIYHVNGADNVISEGNTTFHPTADPRELSHNFAYDGAGKTCGTALCHGYGPAAPTWGQTAGIPISCAECHKNSAGAAATADADDFAWDNGVMSKIRDAEWTNSGHGRAAGTYNSGRSAANFASCTTHCHTSGVSHNSTNNPFRLTDKATPTPNTDFSDAADPQSDNKVCLDCHSATGAYPSGSTLHVEQNHYGLKHNAQTDGGSFCWDCHDPHGDANDSMVQDNVTKVSEGIYGIPSAAGGSRAVATFSKTNLNGEAYNTVYDWGDYVDNTNTPRRGLCQVCHTDPPGASGGTTGGAEHFSPTRFDANHNKLAGVQGDRCTVCHQHGADFGPTCNTCHGDATATGAGGMPPQAPASGNQVWSSSVDNLSTLPGVGNHRTAAGIAFSSHTSLGCAQCHTSTPGSGATHDVSGQLNATMTNIVNHNWYTGAAAAWDDGGTAGATTSVVDDSCANIDCHAPYYNGNAAASGTPTPYRRYWVNATLWDCYTCHAYDGRTGVGSRPRPGGADNTMATGAHGRHVGALLMACSRCHDVSGYSYTAFGGNHKNGFVNWSFAGAPNPPGYPAPPANAYTVPSGSRAPTDDNAAAGHAQWGTCSNIYCHSIVQTASGGPLTGAGGQYATASWDNATTGQCGSCHNDDLNTSGGTGVPMTSGSHAAHLAPGYGMACDVCHTGSGTGHATHADGLIQVPIGDNTWRVFTLSAATTIFDRASAPGVDNVSKVPGAARGRCSNIACHTNGAGGAPRVDNVVWGDGLADCGYCHGANAATLTTNAHQKHLQAGYACGACHYDTAVDNATLRAATGYALHLNGARNVVLDNAYDATPANKTDDWASPNCSNVKCHGGNTVAWNAGALSCTACHTRTNNVDVTADVDDFVFEAGAGTMSKIRPSDYAARGHGLASGNLPWTGGGTPSSTFGRAIACADCHDPAAPHTADSAAGNFFRLLGTINGQTAAFDNVTTVCYACHADTVVKEHAKAVTGGGSSGWDHAQKCVDCHDVHGEGNILMVHDNIVSQTNGGSTYATSYPNGVPYNPSSRSQVVFAANAAGSDYASTDNAAPYDGICEVCHSRTAQYQKDAANGKAGPQGHPTDKCTNCHKHDAGFKGSGCSGCHGAAATGRYWPAASPGAYPNRAGAHDNHVNTIGFWVYGETSTSPGLLDNTIKGTPDAKQKAICAWCHPNPGGPRPGTGETAHWDYVAPADVHRDGRAGASASYLQYHNGNLATPGSDDDTAATYDNGTRSCASAKCHNRNTTPSGANDWRTPPAWSTTGCDSAQCHATPATSGGHYVHYASKWANPIGAGYPCSECHVIPSSLRHANGQVNLFFGGLEATVGGGNGFYDKEPGGTQSAGDNNFKAYDNVYSRTCYNIYCHGGDNAWGGTDDTPVWNDPNTGGCYGVGACHGVYGNAWDYDTVNNPMHEITTGNHGVHFQKNDNTLAKIPGIGPGMSPHPHTGTNEGCAACHNLSGGPCNDCHGGPGAASLPNSTHADGKVDFRTYYPTDVDDPGTTLDATNACNNCHGTGVATAKAQWDNATYRLDCLTCHGATPAYTNLNATGRVAPNEAGDNATYGATILGHNRPLPNGNYPSNNPPAGRTCVQCHDVSIPHIDGTDNTTYGGDRLLGTVNGVSGLTTVSGLCAACHTTAGGSPAMKKSINTHGNAGYPDRLEAVFADRTCDQCHEPHGMVYVSTDPVGVNLWMINPTITVVPGTTVSPVRLFSRTGANSFDNGTAGLCRACHENASNPGSPMTYNVAGQHAAPNYTGDERLKDCSGCHSHNQDAVVATVDGLMPLPCNACHSYPGLDNSASPKQMSAAHGDHAGTPTDVANTKGYECSVCHFNYDHNGTGVAKGAAWPGTYYNNVDINFDPSWNPGSTTYRGVPVPTTGNGGSGACGGLYCHGDSTTLSAGWGGSDNTPVWNQPSTAACGTCHDTGTADTTPTTQFSTKNHPVHLDNVSRAWGPETWRFSGGGNCAEGTGCHTKYGLTPSSRHADKATTLRSAATDNGEVGATLATTQVCRNCHPTYTSANVPTSGDALVRMQANWDNPSYLVDCLTCHNGTAAGTQATANLDGSGGVAHAIEGTIYTMQHGIQGVGCGWCHGDTGHIGTRRPVGSNPYRLTGYFFTGSYAPVTQLGQIDYACKYCHNMFGPADHAWRVSGSGTSGPETKETTDTHPTTVLAVGTGKDRWYQLPPDTQMPVFGDLLDSGYIRSSGSNNYVLCVTCHDPHGVGTSPLAPSVRRFSGQNTDAGGNKALRFNYSSGTPTALCSQCHL